MTRFLQPLWFLLAASADSKLRQMIEYLKAENRALREKLPARITVTDRERARLVKLGSAVGAGLKELITIVSYRTFNRWRLHNSLRPKPRRKYRRGNPAGRGRMRRSGS